MIDTVDKSMFFTQTILSQYAQNKFDNLSETHKFLLVDDISNIVIKGPFCDPTMLIL